MTTSRYWRTGAVGLLVGAVGLLAGACGSSPQADVAHLGSAKTTTSSGPGTPSGTGPANLGSPGGGQTEGRASSGQTFGLSAGNYTDALKYAHCMRSHGVATFPDPDSQGNFDISSGSGVNPGSAAFQSAQAACRKLLPNGGQPTPAQRAAAVAHALQFTQCMRSHGLKDFPDPVVHQGGISISLRAGPGSDLNPHSALFQAAQKACQGLTGLPK
jgi:hypothetical protein